MLAVSQGRTRDEWIALVGEEDTCLTPLLTLAELRDDAFLQVMLDLAADYGTQPMLGWMAATAAARLDPDSGAQALLNLLSVPEAAVRDLAVFMLTSNAVAEWVSSPTEMASTRLTCAR